MSFKPNLAVIIGTLTVAVLYGIMKYAAPDQLANLTEKVTSPFKSELALSDKLSEPSGSISNPLQSELVLEDILPANDAYKADANNTSQDEIAGFFFGQDEADAPCKPDFEILYNEGVPRAKSKQCIIRDEKSITTVVFNNNKVVSISSVVFVFKSNWDNVISLLKSKFGEREPIYGKFISDNIKDHDDDNSGVILISLTKEKTSFPAPLYPVQVEGYDCSLNKHGCNNFAKELQDIKKLDIQDTSNKFLSPNYVIYYKVAIGQHVSWDAEISLTTAEYNVEAKKLGIAIIPMPIPNTENMPCYQQGSCSYHERGSEIKCRNYAMWMYQDAGVLIKYRKDLGLGDEKTIEDTHDAIASRLDYPDSLFLYTAISNYVKNQEAGRQYVASGDFFTDCFNELTR